MSRKEEIRKLEIGLFEFVRFCHSEPCTIKYRVEESPCYTSSDEQIYNIEIPPFDKAQGKLARYDKTK